MKVMEIGNDIEVDEFVFAEGKIYKMGYKDYIKTKRTVRSSITPDQIHSDYYANDKLKSIIPFYGIRKYPDGTELLKIYKETKQLADLVGSEYDSIDISHLDLAPMINLWVYHTRWVEDETTCEVSFNVESFEQLKEIAKYYKLKFPLPENQIDSLKNNRYSWKCDMFFRTMDLANYNFNKNPFFDYPFVLGQIRFKNGKAILIKVYKYKI